MDVRIELDIEAYKSLNLLDTVHAFFYLRSGKTSQKSRTE